MPRVIPTFQTLLSRLVQAGRKHAAAREADQWAVRIARHALSEEELETFVNWLGSNPLHREAYEMSVRVWHNLPSFTPIELNALIGAKRPQNGGLVRRLWQAAGVPDIWLVIGAVACGGLAMIVLLGHDAPISQGLRETARGEQSIVNLSDKSKVYLNTESKVSVSYTDGVRFIQLPAGEAFFEVAPNKDRPFVVQTQDATIRAVGTKFDVRVDAKGTTVAVLEGAVEVKGAERPEDAKVNRARVGVGELVRVQGGTGLGVEKKNVERAAAWRLGWIEFDKVPLQDAVQEINRYRHKSIVIADADLRDLSITGSFRVDHTDGFLKALQQMGSIGVVERDNDYVVLKLN